MSSRVTRCGCVSTRVIVGPCEGELLTHSGEHPSSERKLSRRVFELSRRVPELSLQVHVLSPIPNGISPCLAKLSANRL